jgi:hypothetical protein
MAEKAVFTGAPDGASPEPFLYHATATDKHGKPWAQTFSMSEDPAKDPSLSAQEAADKVKKHIIETRGDLYNRGITWDTLHVVQGGRQTAADKKRVGEILASFADAKVQK